MTASYIGKIAVAFTGGKDSVLALHLVASSAKLSKQGTTDQVLCLNGSGGCGAVALSTAGAAGVSRTSIALVTFAPAGFSNGQGFRAHPIPVIRAQAQALQIPHIVCEIDPSNSLDSYRQQIKQLHEQHGITQLVTGDVLDIADGFMLKAANGTGVQLLNPLWQLPRDVVLQTVFDLGINSVISCINLSKYSLIDQQLPQPMERHMPTSKSPVQDSVLHSEAGDSGVQGQAERGAADVQASMGWNAAQRLLGQQITPTLLSGPLTEAEQLFSADKCGEYGEYHTVVLDAPMFAQPVSLTAQRVVTSGVYAYIEWDCSLL